MTRDLMRNADGEYVTDDTATKEGLLWLGEIVRTTLARLDYRADVLDIMEELTQWREAVEAIDTQRGQATMVIERERHLTFPFTDEDLDE